jgi:hypothetical protein
LLGISPDARCSELEFIFQNPDQIIAYDNHPLARAVVIALRCLGLRRVLVRGWAARQSRCFRVYYSRQLAAVRIRGRPRFLLLAIRSN